MSHHRQVAAGAKFDIELGADHLKDLVQEYKKVMMVCII